MTRPSRSERLGDERVAGRAQLGLPDVRRLDLLEAGHRPHDRVPALVDRERPEDLAHAVGPRRAQTKLPLNDVARAEAIARRSGGRPCTTRRRARGDRRARRRAAIGIAQDRRPSRPAACAVFCADRHVARRALVLDLARLGRMIDRLAANAGVEVRIPRRVRHDRRPPPVPIDTSSPAGVDRLLWHATQFSEWTNSPAAACALGRALPRGCAAGPEPASVTATSRTSPAAHQSRRETETLSVVRHHFQKLVNGPSNQSHSR